MTHLRNDFAANAPITQVPASWFNRVANFINGFIAGKNCKVVVNTDGSPSYIDVDDMRSEGTALNPPFQTGANIDSDSAIDGAQFLNNPNVTAAELRKTWTRGDTDSQGNKVGTKLTVCTGMKRYQVGVLTTTQALYSVLSFDENGCLCKVETAQSWYKAD